jgi:pimeloyl-ACP methyl ester carboxylesterase
MTRPTFLLVHGGCHRASCWDRLIPALRTLGREAIAIDLPGHGRDSVADPVPATLDDGIAATVAAIREIEGSVVLVGHSLGGLSISGAAERLPEQIAQLVYLTALVPRDGEDASVFADLPGFNASIGSYMLDDGLRVGVRPELARHLFYADCDGEIAAAATAALVPTDLGYLTTPVSLSEGRFGAVPKAYILCRQDNAIEPRAQRVLATVHPGTDLVEIDASHSAFLSRPDELAALLDRF